MFQYLPGGKDSAAYSFITIITHDYRSCIAHTFTFLIAIGIINYIVPLTINLKPARNNP